MRLAAIRFQDLLAIGRRASALCRQALESRNPWSENRGSGQDLDLLQFWLALPDKAQEEEAACNRDSGFE